MQEINSFVISFCSGCILLGFLYMLCPSGNMNAPVKYIFCLCFVCCIIGVIVGIKPPDFTAFDKVSNQQILTEQNTAITAQSIFAEALKKQNINFRKITVDTNKMSDGSIIISRITVYTSEASQRIKDVLGCDSYEVIVVNE